MSARTDSRSPRRGIRYPEAGAARRWLPLLLLLGSLAVAALATLQAQQSARSHRATAEGLLRDYAAIASWTFRQQASGQLATAFHQTIEPAAHGKHSADGRILPVEALWRRQLEAADTGCAIVRPGAPYYFRITPAGTVSFSGTAPSEAVQRWIADAVPAHASARDQREEEVMFGDSVDGAWRFVVYAAMGAPDEPAHLYGFGMDPERYRKLMAKTFEERALLPAALMGERKNDEMLAARIVLPSGERVFEWGDDVSWELSATDTLGSRFGGMIVQTTVRPQVASSLIIGGLPRSRLPFLIGLFLLAACLAAVAAGQLRREAELTRLRADFVSSASHELRTPLAQIRLFLETLRLGRYSSQTQREWILENLDRETRRLTGLVENVLHFSRERRPPSNQSRPEVLLAPLLERIVSDFRPLASSRHVEFELAAAPGLVVPAEADALRQVMLNLLDNAVKYGPVGQTVRVTAGAADGGRAAIAVADEGPGVDLAERERIWEPFRRGAGAVGSVVVGSGIGLSVVREIVASHGGTARVEDAPGGGARFVVELPGARMAPLLPSEPLEIRPVESGQLLEKVG